MVSPDFFIYQNSKNVIFTRVIPVQISILQDVVHPFHGRQQCETGNHILQSSEEGRRKGFLPKHISYIFRSKFHFLALQYYFIGYQETTMHFFILLQYFKCSCSFLVNSRITYYSLSKTSALFCVLLYTFFLCNMMLKYCHTLICLLIISLFQKHLQIGMISESCDCRCECSPFPHLYIPQNMIFVHAGGSVFG